MKATDFSQDCPGTLVPIVEGSIAFVPDPLPPAFPFDFELQGLHETAVLALGELRAIVPSLPNPQLISTPFLHREAVLSSRIEGTRTELEQLYLFEASEPKPRRGESEQVQDAREVLNYVRAMQHGLARLNELPVSHRLIKEMHLVLMTDVRGRDRSPGEYRRCQNFIGSSYDLHDARFVPPPPERVAAAMDDLEKYIHFGVEYPSLVRIALIHYQFEAIHPFEDGNGRIGRLLISLLVSVYGLVDMPILYLSAYFERNRLEYYDRIAQVSRRGDWRAWVQFFLEGVAVEARDASRRSRKLLALREEWRSELQRSGSSANVLALVDALFQNPVISVPAVQSLLQMTYRGAKRNVDKLVAEGYIVEVTGHRRNRVYLAKPIAEILSSDRISEPESH